MNTKSNAIGWAGLVLALLAILIGAMAYLRAAPSDNTGAAIGGGTVLNLPFMPKGMYLGGQKSPQSADQLVIDVGKNQAIWTNRTGKTVYVFEGDLITNGVASSTFNFYVGTTSTSTMPTNGIVTRDTFIGGFASFFAPFITATTSTSTPAGVVADNNASHLSASPSGIAVADGQSLLLQIGSFCKASGTCETATSTTRGFGKVILDFTYNIGLP